MNHLPTQPTVVAYGMGVDSTAVLVGLAQRNQRPDLILFADVGAEKPETYAYLPIINAWLDKVGFPQITVVKYEPVRATYNTLEEKCLTNQTLPSLAYGMHSCSLVFKVEPQNKYLKRWQPAIVAWACGGKVTKMIGYDNGAQDCKRSSNAGRMKASKGDDRFYDYVYPLQVWGWDRERCEAEILAAGLPVPVKSACFFCPASKKHEIDWLAKVHPELAARALKLEAVALTGKHDHSSTKGLGRRFSWADYLASKKPCTTVASAIPAMTIEAEQTIEPEEFVWEGESYL